MKLSTYAKKLGLSYTTVYRMWKDGQVDAYQLPTGTVIVRERAEQLTQSVALYARVSSADQKGDLNRQMERLRQYAASKGYQVTKEVKELASGVNDSRPKLAALLQNSAITTIVVEHTDRLTRFGFHYIRLLMEAQKRTIEVMNATDTGDDLVDDFVAVITSMAARLYGRRNAKNRAEKIKKCIEDHCGDSSRI